LFVSCKLAVMFPGLEESQIIQRFEVFLQANDLGSAASTTNSTRHDH
jgi:hypothetical protein